MNEAKRQSLIFNEKPDVYATGQIVNLKLFKHKNLRILKFNKRYSLMRAPR